MSTIYIIPAVVQTKVYDRVFSLNQFFDISISIYRQFFLSKHVFKINRKKVIKKLILRDWSVNLKREIRGIKSSQMCRDLHF